MIGKGVALGLFMILLAFAVWYKRAYTGRVEKILLVLGVATLFLGLFFPSPLVFNPEMHDCMERKGSEKTCIDYAPSGTYGVLDIGSPVDNTLYCRNNPSDSDKCRCLKNETFSRINMSSINKYGCTLIGGGFTMCIEANVTEFQSIYLNGNNVKVIPSPYLYNDIVVCVDAVPKVR